MEMNGLIFLAKIIAMEISQPAFMQMDHKYGISTASITEQMGLLVNMQMAQKYGISMTNGTKRTALPGLVQLV
jgi:hypothetical protein